jgi:hypothetical protein
VRKIERVGNLPKMLQQFGMFDTESSNKLETVLKKLPPEYRDILKSSTFEVYECGSVTELATQAAFDDCEKQIVTDLDSGRYYFCALTIDPGRHKSRVEEDELGYDLVPDTSPRSARVLYFIEVSHGDYKRWIRSNVEQKLMWLEDRKRREEEERLKVEARAEKKLMVVVDGDIKDEVKENG